MFSKCTWGLNRITSFFHFPGPFLLLPPPFSSSFSLSFSPFPYRPSLHQCFLCSLVFTERLLPHRLAPAAASAVQTLHLECSLVLRFVLCIPTEIDFRDDVNETHPMIIRDLLALASCDVVVVLEGRGRIFDKWDRSRKSSVCISRQLCSAFVSLSIPSQRRLKTVINNACEFVKLGVTSTDGCWIYNALALRASTTHI